ncbi:MAG TPA: 2,3,4,5-tetrahydropyridine-2,6-dicarboxylate N-succinyltransferase [Myxococcales bacterium]|nr:2,3,4,5-tetrahydropyridine-2,6-dicarboxylate N-succinyltransferase [Myxococcales bacterium]
MSDPRQSTIEAAFADRSQLTADAAAAVHSVIADLDVGKLRVASCIDEHWVVHQWVKQAISLYFAVTKMQVHEVGPFEFHDKIALKKDLATQGVRVVPPGVARYGSHLEAGAILMPGYVNIGAYVGAGTMVDTWATVGSCAQIGKRVHLSGGVGIGGVLEPPSASPVIIEDGAFIGSRSIVVEGVKVGKQAVLGANVVLTKSTQIIDVTSENPKIYKGEVPPRAVVIPGTRPKQFPAGEFGVPCALIIGERKASTDEKTSLNDVLRDFAVAV